MRRTIAVEVVFALVVLVFAAVPTHVNAANEVPFKGNMDGSTVTSGNPAVERYEVSGQASHLGKYTAVVEADLTQIQIIGFDPDAGLPIATLPLTATFTAANGDELYADIVLVGLFHPVNQNFPAFTFDATITGGTGRHDGATGSFTGEGGQTSVPGPDNDLLSGTFSGTISTVGSNKK